VANRAEVAGRRKTSGQGERRFFTTSRQGIDRARRGEALPSLEKVKALLAETRSKDEVRKIRAIAQAVATLERGKEIACDAGEIIVLADRRRAELEKEEREARPTGGAAHASRSKHVRLTESKRVAESRRAPLLELPEPDQQTYFDKCLACSIKA
jgi:hypothetical protein